MSRLILILGDQLSHDLVSLSCANKSSDSILMGELADEASYVHHHAKKLVFVFSAMRHFAQQLREDGWSVSYQHLDDENAVANISDLVARALDQGAFEELIVTEPGEWRLKQVMDGWPDKLGLPVTILEDGRFLASHAEFDAWADGRKQLRMEYFYRDMRRKTGLLMDGDAPVGGQWNYDHDNRKPAKSDMFMPKPLTFTPGEIVAHVTGLVEDKFPEQFGDIKQFSFPVTRDQALEALDHFINCALPCFGDYQDAMLDGEPFLYHSLLSPALNVGLLSPIEICERVQQAYYDGDVPINAAEGFIRQIIGWREYVRGIYWREGPDYPSRNYFETTRDLPDFYWSGDTDMACMKAAIGQTIEHAYAHHIQRLMVTGNFALIAGIDPHQVHEWYLAVYADAYEWVEAPNTVGMALFADGGLLGSKPYAASGAYINRMSDYCASCSYAVSKRDEENACPFNALYWDFLIRNRNKLKSNHRLSRIYSNWDRMSEDKQTACRTRASKLLKMLDAGHRL